MQSSNPLLTRATVEVGGPVMTIQGAVQKSALLLIIASIVAFGLFSYASLSNPALGWFGTVGGGVLAFVFALIIAFKNSTAKFLAIPLAVAEGLFMGGVSVAYNMQYPGMPLTAIMITFLTAGTMFALYRYRIIQATAKFRAVIVSATIAIMLTYLVQMAMVWIFKSSIPGIFDSGIIGIGFAGFVAVIAALNLILDFDLIERGANMRASQSFEWVAATGLLITLVWLYVSILRLLSISRD